MPVHPHSIDFIEGAVPVTKGPTQIFLTHLPGKAVRASRGKMCAWTAPTLLRGRRLPYLDVISPVAGVVSKPGIVNVEKEAYWRSPPLSASAELGCLLG